MWEDSRYFCVDLCKNHWFHVRRNLFFRHRIPLALALLSIAASGSDATSAAKSMSINPPKC